MPADSDGEEPLPHFVPDLPAQDLPSEYARPNQILFRETHAYQTVGGRYPGLAGLTYDGDRHFLPLFDTERANADTLDALISEWGCLYPIPEAMAQQLVRRGFAADQHDEDSDYVYAARAFETYAGRVLHPKRNLFKQFITRAAPSSEPVAGHEDAALAVLAGWLADVGKSPSASDYGPCARAIATHSELGLTGRIAFTAMGEPAGFVIASRLGKDCAVIHFAKGRRALNGVYPFLFSDFVRHAPDVHWLNFEQDLGNPGFRQNKQSYAPHKHIAKYRIRQRPATDR